MTAPKSGWTVFCSEVAGQVLHSLPEPIEDRLTRFLCELAWTGGALVDSGAPPPGKPLDAVGVEYTVSVNDLDVCVEYMVIADIKEFYITDIVWAG
ncbi:hypothetical protein AGRA3207_001355 [Actinomadura graeca]|uniref:Uncharacterized protein n=1 Tax=Actinomadura graeca TaxID=2750812 RepID=A0ABX8QPR4_9ACTN|nr:hypothetical protein [Actinomadura graeca]QXJ20613.1 hypothetical protein AGRA3207_001355 [Actinomadura graeca]